PQILVGGASADASDSRGAPSSSDRDFAAAPSAAIAPEAYAALSVAGAAQTFWGQSADAWSARARALRDGPGVDGVQAWAQAHGGAETLDQGAGLKASWRGVQAGIDRRSTQGARSLWWGATVGFTDYDADAGPDAFELRGANLGAYAGGQWGGFYAAALVKADRIDAEAAFTALSRRTFDGVSWGARGEVGYRFGSARLFLEPSAALAWVETDLDGFSDGGTGFDYDDATSLRGRTGVRVGGEATIGNAVFVPYVGVHAAGELDGENRMRVTDGETYQLVDEGRGSWAEAEVGVSGATWFGLEAFAEAKALSGGDVRGWSARLGARWRW
ncbi:autotransporter outer membrane beta-barrel domain-containing protein, partial [Caulobacter sp. 17J65-9]|uniref:autotransporter outer membrane beta-barrel domain-containing protein n=1 Tax=Caulobacter sp. 17J65-9 TaxID=2709382 RepID=UPI0013C5CEA1